ncbi:MAG: ATP-binding protein [Desulfobacterales bacterium]|nr:ATP-binding protein [Desulfobacterales bacterium]
MTHTQHRSIARRFIFWILIFSSCVTLLLTSIQLMLDYNRDLNLIEQELVQIETSYQQAFSQSLWVMDNLLLETQISGVLKIPDIEYLETRKDGTLVTAMGREKKKRILTRQFELFYNYRNNKVHLGYCLIHADLSQVYNRLIEKAVIILLGQGAKTFLVSIYIFFLFYHLIGKHLKTISDFTRHLDLKKDAVLELERGSDPGKIDELTLMTRSFNEMMASLRESYRDQYHVNQSLQSEVDERKAAEAKLQKNHDLVNAILEGTTDAIFLKNKRGEYQLANAACLNAFGKTRREVIGKTDDDLFPPESARAVKERDAEVMGSGQSLLFEERLETAYGDSYWMSNKAPFRDREGKIIGLIGIARNVTELKLAREGKQELERRLQQAQKMEAIGTLAGGIAHDFNNILAAIFGYTDLAAAKMPKDCPAGKSLERVKVAGHRAKDLVRQILTFSRQDDAELTAVLPAPIVKEGIKMIRSSIPTTIRIVENIDSGCREVLANPTQLYQIVLNLCTNAYHAMEASGGDLHISLLNRSSIDGRLDSDAGADERWYVSLVIQDSGPGIPEEFQARIFEPYFTTKAQGKGTGMGLAIVHGIVESYGGRIEFHSTPETGTRFEILLPVSDDVQATADEPVKELETGKEHILFVDDETAIADMGKELLEGLGYSVTASHDSAEALDSFTRNPCLYDLVITDQTMPGITGIELAQRIHSIRPGLPVILSTGYSSQVSDTGSLEGGISTVLPKPVTKKEYARSVRTVLDEHLASETAVCDPRLCESKVLLSNTTQVG